MPCVCEDSLSEHGQAVKRQTQSPALRRGSFVAGMSWLPAHLALADQVAPWSTSGILSQSPGPVKHVCDQVGELGFFDTFRRDSTRRGLLNKIRVLLSAWLWIGHVVDGEQPYIAHNLEWLGL